MFQWDLQKQCGGILVDKKVMKKTAIISTLGALPFLIAGDNLMLVSIIGVMFFSMTMAITLGLLVSVLKKTPGLAFGLTTIGLFLGTVPIFIFKISYGLINNLMIIILTIICLAMLLKIIRKEE